MKPIRLELKEFGPYKDEIIEWDKIINEPIFLITGKTGSGKSTLFDAITYALYNKTTGGKDIASLRTKTAADKDKTQVNFDFELSGKRYRIERTLAYLKTGNKNLTSGKVVLMEYNSEKQDIIATKEQEVKEKIEELIGLDDKQFCQIIILPQGKFKEFLLSKSSEKKETLRSLFNTYFYQKFVDQLQEQAKKLDTNRTFSKAISYLDEQLDYYDNALTEILELDINSATYADQIQTILAKYNFKYEALKEKLLNSETSELEQDHKTSVTKKEETKKELGNRESSKKDTTSSNKNSNSTKNNSSDTKKVSSIPNTQNHPQIVGQQVPETYNTIRYTQEGSTSRNIIENELKGDISNFTNEEINAAIANYNAKNQG